MPGTGPMPSRSGPWHSPHAIVFAVAAFRHEGFTLLDRPCGDVGDRSHARIPQHFGLLGVLGCLHDADADRLLARALTLDRTHDTVVALHLRTVLVSTTRTHGVHLMAPKYSAACRISSGVSAFAIQGPYGPSFALRGSALLRRSWRKSSSCCMKYDTGKARHAGVLGTALSSDSAPHEHLRGVGSPARPVATDARHHAMVLRGPVGLVDAV